MARARAVLSAVFCAVLALPPAVGAAGYHCGPPLQCLRPGDRDPSFAATPLEPTGMVWTRVGSVYSGGAHDMVVQPDGKIVLAGNASDAAGSDDLAMVRYEAGGPLDAGFGTGGIVRTPLGFEGSGEAVALQPDGAIVVAGTTRAASFVTGGVVARYLPDGTLDTTFGSGGLVFTSDPYSDVLVDPDGRIVVAGRRGVELVLARFAADGSPDPTLGGTGSVATALGGHLGYGAHAVLREPDGRLLVGGATQVGKFIGCALARFLDDGTPDGSFGSGGAVVVPQPSGDVCHVEALVPAPDGTILAAGGAVTGPRNRRTMRVMRFLPDGTLDPRYGKRGVFDTQVDRRYAEDVTVVGHAVAVKADGGAYVGGGLGGGVVAVAGIKSTGRKDKKFARGGTLVGSPNGGATGALDGTQALAILPDGRLLAAGNVHGDFGVTRFVTRRCAFDRTTSALTCE